MTLADPFIGVHRQQRRSDAAVGHAGVVKLWVEGRDVVEVEGPVLPGIEGELGRVLAGDFVESMWLILQHDQPDD
ncbi:MAG: hypothetical protein QNL88_11880, partial [Acidobacteriota bacterium]|nr:hypothetical protein [Acidobacteriota bacterium]